MMPIVPKKWKRFYNRDPKIFIKKIEPQLTSTENSIIPPCDTLAIYNLNQNLVLHVVRIIKKDQKSYSFNKMTG